MGNITRTSSLERLWQMGEMLKLLIIKNLNSQNIRHSLAWGSGSLVKTPVAGFDPWREPTPWIVSPLASRAPWHGQAQHTANK